MRSILLALSLAGCASMSPTKTSVDSAELAQLRAQSAELQRIVVHLCEEGCTRDVLGKCVIDSVEAPGDADENCIHDRSLACLINCAP